MAREPIRVAGNPGRADFTKSILAESDVDANLCFQCRKCAAGCPLAFAMDLAPNQIIHAIRLGQRDLVLRSKSIWMCVSCETCTARCPQGVDIAKLMDAARITALAEGIEPAVPEVAQFHRKAMKSIRRHGRMFELGLIIGLKLGGATGLFDDIGMGMKMVSKGKMKFLPSFGKAGPVKRMMKRAGGSGKRGTNG